MDFKEALQALLDGKRIAGDFYEYELRDEVLHRRCGDSWEGNITLHPSSTWSIIPRETTHTKLTIQQCAELALEHGDSAISVRRGGGLAGWRPWHHIISHMALESADLAATDWEAKVVEGE